MRECLIPERHKAAHAGQVVHKVVLKLVAEETPVHQLPTLK